MYIYIETLNIGIKENRKTIKIEIKDFHSEYQILLTTFQTEVVMIPNIRLDNDFVINQELGCIICPHSSIATTQAVKCLLEYWVNNGYTIESIKSDESMNTMIDFEMIQSFESKS